jgi:hypothetical protein
LPLQPLLLDFCKAFGILICVYRGQLDGGGKSRIERVDLTNRAFALENSWTTGPNFT